MLDQYRRAINYLRISITDHCDLRCIYCVPFSGRPKLAHHEILSYEEILILVRLAVNAGIDRVRITGGEPLLRKGVVAFFRQLAAIDGLAEVTLTTNGVRLADMASDLHSAGISRINVSLDTLNRRRYLRITGKDRLEQVMMGIAQAEKTGMAPIKINTVAMRGINDDEIHALARLSFDKPYHIRFIELMPTSGWRPESHTARFMPVVEMKEKVCELGSLEPFVVQKGNGPAQTFRIPGALGTVGFIAALSNHFCQNCNRLRLTSDGKLRNCLFSDAEIDIKGPLRQGASQQVLERLLWQAIKTKPLGHKYGHCDDTSINRRPMQAIGG